MNQNIINKSLESIFSQYIDNDTIDYTAINQLKTSCTDLVNRYENKVRAQRFLAKFPNINDLIKKNSVYNNIHSGKRCFIIGNGPSLNMQDLTLIKDEITFTVNNLAQCDKFLDVQSNYHFIADPIYFDDGTDLRIVNYRKNFFKLLEKMKSINPGMPIFVPTLGYDFIRKYKLDNQYNFVYYHSSLDFYDGFDQFDYSAPQPAYINVIHYAIAWAIYMGFSKIYLLGCDASLMNPAHCYEAPSAEKGVMGCTIQQCSPEELHRGMALVHHTYAQLLEACRRRNIELVNATAETLIECLPRQKYETLFSKEGN